MASGDRDKKIRMRISRGLLQGVIVRVAVLIVAVILLFQFSALFSGIVFTDRLDEEQAVAIKYRFSALPFDSRCIRLNHSGEEVSLLNFTYETQTFSLYSEDLDLNEIKNIGVLERDGEPFFILWFSNVSDEKEYVISGSFKDFYKFGTRERMAVLFVEEYHEFGLIDEVLSKGKLALFQIILGFVALTSAFFLAFLGTVFWIIDKIGGEEDAKEQSKAT